VQVAPYADSLLNWFRQFPLFGWTIPNESCEFIREMGADAVQYDPELITVTQADSETVSGAATIVRSQLEMSPSQHSRKW